MLLSDGSYFRGQGFGVTGEVSGEVVFSTSMVGYTEALTDPSYTGQILTLTYPLIGNYGVPSYYEKEHGLPLYFESESVKVGGLVVHELCERPHHWTSTRSLDEWLVDEGVPGISGVDTRKLTKKLRAEGVLSGILKTYEEGEEIDLDELLEKVRLIVDPNAQDLVGQVSVREPILHEAGGHMKVVLIDCGVKYGILRSLLKRRVDIVRVPHEFSAKEILEYHPKSVIISNGPGDPKRCAKTTECVKELVEEGIPTIGICLGNQILALTLGGDTYKMKYGHRSQNQPALDLKSNRCYITTQNHGYAVDSESLRGTGLKVRFLNANDMTVEGVEHNSKPIFAVQWHPEGGPGPFDTEFIFDNFLHLVR